jgi:WD40 repeat protein
LWDPATHKQLGEPLTGHTGSVLAVAWSPDGKTLATASGDKSVRLWSVR